jgi:hypothetical protein
MWLHLFLHFVTLKSCQKNCNLLFDWKGICMQKKVVSNRWESKTPIWEPNLAINWVVQDYLRQFILQLELWHSNLSNVWVENWRIRGLPTIVLPIWIAANHNLESLKQVCCVNSSQCSSRLSRCQTPISKFQYDIHMKMVWYFVNLIFLSNQVENYDDLQISMQRFVSN